MSTIIDDPFDAAHDAKMSWLQDALDPEVARKELRRALGAVDPGGKKFNLTGIRVLRHKPGRRCLVEYLLTPEGGDPHAVLGKTRSKGTHKESFLLQEQLRLAGLDGRAGAAVPRGLGMSSLFLMWFQDKVPGTVMTEAIATPEGIGLARRVAEAAHEIHKLPLKPRREHLMADELRILAERIESLAVARPAWRARLTKLMEAAHRLGAGVPSPKRCAIHRDFYPAQVLVEGERLWLLDFELFTLGDPAVDAGNFIAHLTEQALRTTGNAAGLEDREAALAERFLTLTGAASQAALEAYTTLTLMRHIQISTMFPERQALTEQLLELCEQRLG